MKILGIIPARYASTRLPGKPLINIHGLPMVVRTYHQACQAKGLHHVLVATDDDRIAATLADVQIPYCMTSSKHVNGTSRCWEAYTKQDSTYDYIVNIQGDEPFLQPVQIEALLNLPVSVNDLQVGTLIKCVTDAHQLLNPHAVKVVCGLAGQALYFSRNPIPHVVGHANVTSALQRHVFYKHIGIYIYATDVLAQLVNLAPHPLEQAESLEQLRWLAHGYTIHTSKTTLESMDINTPADLAHLAAYKSTPHA